MAHIAKEQSKIFNFDTNSLSLEIVRDIYFYNDLPKQLKCGEVLENVDSLSFIIGDLMGRLMASNNKSYSVSITFSNIKFGKY